MTRLFVFGTLCHPPLLRVVLGRDAVLAPAILPGHEVRWVAGASYPMLCDGVAAAGMVMEVDAADLARLDFYEACFEYLRVPVQITLDDAALPAMLYRPADPQGTPGAPWSLEDWAQNWGAISTLAAVEVMRQMGRVTPSEIGQRFGMIRARAQSFLRAQDWRRAATVARGARASEVVVDAQRYPYDGFFTMEEMIARFPRFDGTLSAPVERGVFRAADAVTVLPYDPVRDRVLLIEQVRFGALGHGDPAPWLLESVAGIVDAGETEAATAIREAAEESGVTILALHLIARYYPSPGGIAQVLTSYIGIADLPDDLPGVGGLDSECEDILSHLVPFDQAFAMIASGEAAVGPLIIGLQYLALNRDRLRAATAG
jgi:nudix-type nucleoside diphosphatase (YffH/AdpP family)